MKNKVLKSLVITAICLSVLFNLSGCGGNQAEKPVSALNPDAPVTVTVWNYYNGDQLDAFNKLVESFNSTVGLEKGIVVIGVSQGDIDTLADALIASVKGEAGAQEIPTLAAVYSETAFILDESDALAAMDKYFTSDELSAYIPGFLEEGRFSADKQLKLFPILKSTELFSANSTDWAEFEKATGIKQSSIVTKEDLTVAAKKYYEWTDSLTPDVAEDGKALYGRDSVSNYIYIGTHQLGQDMFTVKDGKLSVNLDKATFKILWDNYYIPFINGYFGAYARFRSEDCKTGDILCLTSSSSSAGYLPTAVTLNDDTSHDIETYITADLPFKNSNAAVVQQGASYCLFKSDDGVMEGAVEFLKWFTEPGRNLDFAMMSGYSPVTVSANNKDAISEAYKGDTTSLKDKNVLNALLTSANAFQKSESYAVKPFNGSKEVRFLLGDLLENAAVNDRAKVVAAIEGGKTLKEATAEFITEEYFNAFYDDMVKQVNETVGSSAE